MNPEESKLLAQHSTKIEALCRLQAETKKDIKTLSDKLDHKFEHLYDGLSDNFGLIHKKIETKTDNSTFRWIIGLIFIALITIGSYSRDNLEQLTELKKDSQFIQKIHDEEHQDTGVEK